MNAPHGNNIEDAIIDGSRTWHVMGLQMIAQMPLHIFPEHVVVWLQGACMSG